MSFDCCPSIDLARTVEPAPRVHQYHRACDLRGLRRVRLRLQDGQTASRYPKPTGLRRGECSRLLLLQRGIKLCSASDLASAHTHTLTHRCRLLAVLTLFLKRESDT